MHENKKPRPVNHDPAGFLRWFVERAALLAERLTEGQSGPPAPWTARGLVKGDRGNPMMVQNFHSTQGETWNVDTSYASSGSYGVERFSAAQRPKNLIYRITSF